MQDFIKQLADFAHQDLGRAANNPVPQIAIPAKILQNPGQFAQNALGGAGNFIKSLVNTPGAIVKSVANGTEGQDLQNVGKGIVEQYKGIAKDPYGSFIKDPVNTSLAIAPAGKLLDAGAAGEAAASVPKPPASWTSEGMKVAAKKSQGLPSVPGMNLVSKSPEEIAAAKAPAIDPYDAQKFNSQYTIPTKRAGKNDLNTLDTSTKILQHVKSGMTVDPNTAPDLVTGDNGLVTQMTRDYYGQVQGSVDMNKPINAAQSILGKSAAMTDADEERAITAIKRTLPGNTADPMDVYDKARELQTLGWQYKRKSTYLTDNMKAEHIGDAYIAAGDNMLDQLDTMAKKDGVIDAVKTPERMAKAKQISPLLHDQLMAAKDGQELRSTASPFVKLSKMQDLDQDAKNSTFSKVAAGMQQGLNVGGTQINAQNLIKQPKNILGDIAANTIDRKLAPMYENFNRKKMGGASSFLPPLGQTAAQLAMNPSIQNGALKVAGDVSRSGLPGKLATGLGAITAANASTPQGQPQQQGVGEPQIPAQQPTMAGQAPTTIPQSINDIKPDNNGNYAVANPFQIKGPDGSSLALSALDYQQQLTQLNAQKASGEYTQNPIFKNNVDQQISTLQSKKQLSDGLGSAYRFADSINKATSDARTILRTAPVNLLTMNDTYEKLLNAANGQYRQLAQDMKYIEDNYPAAKGTLFTPQTSTVALQALDKTNQQMLSDYYSKINEFTGGEEMPGQPVNTAQQTGLPAIKQSGNGGSVQGHPLASF